MTRSEGPGVTFPFRIGRWSRLPLLIWGVTPKRAEVRADGDVLTVRFGFVGTTIPLGDITRWKITGPYSWVRAIGVRHTLFTNDVSFCGDRHGAVAVQLRSRRRIAFFNADLVYLGVDDLAGLAAALSDRGIPGEDRRH
jgi:hypothetical protein